MSYQLSGSFLCFRGGLKEITHSPVKFGLGASALARGRTCPDKRGGHRSRPILFPKPVPRPRVLCARSAAMTPKSSAQNGQWGGSESSVPLPTPPRDGDPPGLGLVVPETPSNETNLVKFGERSRTSPCRPRLGVQFHSRPAGSSSPSSSRSLLNPGCVFWLNHQVHSTL